ncbi:MAG: hypothetical protein ACJARS_005095 [bacterium]|jgi:hypothetical protein
MLRSASRLLTSRLGSVLRTVARDVHDSVSGAQELGRIDRSGLHRGSAPKTRAGRLRGAGLCQVPQPKE